jgi:hypothetical protein
MKWLKLRLQIIGATSLILLAIGTVWSFHQYSGDRIDSSKPKDAQFVLNWGGIPITQDFKVTESSESTRNFTGDHLDYFASTCQSSSLPKPPKKNGRMGRRRICCWPMRWCFLSMMPVSTAVAFRRRRKRTQPT